MTLQEKILRHWNIPVKALAWQKLVLENRGLLHELRLSTWQSQILEINDFTKEELSLLKHVIICIDSMVEHFDAETLFSLISETMARYTQGRFVLLKYAASVTYGDLWNEWYRFTRGSVFDLQEIEISSFALFKFYNLNEKESTQLPLILDKMSKGRVTQYIKEDGSNVSVSFYDHQRFVNTPGGFDSDQSHFSENLLIQKHPSFIKALEHELSDYTFVFEYVSPFNQIVVHYSQEELILLHVLDKRNGRVLPIADVRILAVRFGFRACRTVTDDFITLIEDSKDVEKYPAQEQEGWVIRIDNEDDTYFLKLKCSDYVSLHRVIAQALNPRWILESIIDETIDDKIALIESEEIRTLVSKMLNVFYGWNEKKREELQAQYTSFPGELWIEDGMLDNFLSFTALLEGYLPAQSSDSYKQRVRAFLEAFSKGKLDNPKEELILLAQNVAEKVRDRFSSLEGYDAYKMKTSIWTANFIKRIKEAVETFVSGGLVDEELGPFVVSKFESFRGFIRPEWEEIFAARKDDFTQLAQSKRENLRPQQFEMHAYAQNKLLFLKIQKDTLALIKQEVSSFLIGDRQELDETLRNVVPTDLVIDPVTRVFYEELRHFENEELFTMLPSDLHVEKANTVLKEVMLFLRGKESDDAFSVAKSIFLQVPEALKDQTAYYKARGAFSAYVNQKVSAIFKPVFFEAINIPKQRRNDYFKEKSFYELIDVVTDTSPTELSENQLDFREIQRMINDKSNEE